VKQSELWDAIVTALRVPVLAKPRPLTVRERALGATRALRVLVVEDNPVNQQLALHLLERRGHSAMVAENGREALSAIEKYKFDLVLMDVQMPEMGGLEATQAIREREKFMGGHLPVVAMTAHAMQGDRERCFEAGMDGYLAKPLDPKVFLQTVEHSALPEDKSEAERGVPDSGRAVEESALLARFSGDRKLVLTLATAFRKDCPVMMARIRTAIRVRDAAALADAVHALKGSIGNFGSSDAFESAREVEKLAREGKLGGARELCSTLEKQIAAFLPALQAIAQGKAKRRIRSRKSQRRKK
jgi:two-component system sensor histidine kinase/response regulator